MRKLAVFVLAAITFVSVAFGLSHLPRAHADAPTTYTVEPFLGGTFGANVTQQQFGGRYCPCVKIPYMPDGFHNQEGADAIDWVVNHLMQPGDTLMGFSLGVQVISLYLSQHSLPPGIHVVLAGDTFARNAELVAAGQGIPWDIANDVTMVVNEYDAWSDKPTKLNFANWLLVQLNSTAGTQRMHYYANADPDAPENLRETRGNITAITIPTEHLPANMWLRPGNDAKADELDEKQRPIIDSAYDRPTSNPEQRKAAARQQVPQPNPAWAKAAEPAAAIG